MLLKSANGSGTAAINLHLDAVAQLLFCLKEQIFLDLIQ